MLNKTDKEFQKMIILACDGCGQQSPNERGERIADDWVNVNVQTQRQRSGGRSGAQICFCADCFRKLDREGFLGSQL